jgi:LAO/AO transport system kinase
LWSLIGERLERAFRLHPGVAAALTDLEADVASGRTTPPLAAERLIAAFLTQPQR